MREAATRFCARDFAGFLACFAESAAIYDEPGLTPAPRFSSRAQVREALDELGPGIPKCAVELAATTENPPAVATEVVIVAGEGGTADVWRLALAVQTSDDLITEVRAFRDLADATAAIGSAA